MGILSWIVVGLFAGWLAGMVIKGSSSGVVGNIIVGIVGALLAGWVGITLLHINAGMSGINLESILVALIGAVLLLVILRIVEGPRRSTLH